MLKKKNKKQIPDEFLRLKPKRLDFEWYTTEENLVRIKVPKFKSKFGRAFCRLIRKEDTFEANLDEIGSFIWKECDGKKTVKKILEKLKKGFPEEEKLEQRFALFLRRMIKLDYMTY